MVIILKKQKLHAKDIVARFCVVVMVLFMAGIMLRMFSRLVLVKKFEMDNAFTRLVFAGAMSIGEVSEDVSVDWQELYPFEEEAEKAVGASDGAAEEGLLTRYANKIKYIEENISPYLEKWLPGYISLVQYAKSYEDIIGWNLSVYSDYNSVTKLEDGQLTVFSEKVDVSRNVVALSEFKDFCVETGAEFIYVQSPHKISKYTDTDISGILDFSNQNADDFLAGLEAEGIDYLDIREEIYEAGFDHHGLFFRTDHHWKPETGLWASGILAEELKERYGFLVDTEWLEAEKFEAVVYEDYFLGSRGRRVTLAQTEPDDISLLYPNYDTSVSFLVPSKGIDATGDFSVMYDMSQLETIDYYNLSPYSAYNYGNPPLVVTHNNLIENGTHILFIKDSFVNTVAPFMAMGVERVDQLDLRYFTGSVEAYIKETQPDVVIVMYTPSAIEEIDWSTHKSTFDFR